MMIRMISKRNSIPKFWRTWKQAGDTVSSRAFSTTASNLTQSSASVVSPQAATLTNSPPTTTRVILYEGPFASLTLRLKRISITSAFISVTGIPLVILYKTWFLFSSPASMMDVATAAVESASVSVEDPNPFLSIVHDTTDTPQPPSFLQIMSKHVIVGGTGILVGTGSTLALSYCFSPYVHTLEEDIIHPRTSTIITPISTSFDDKDESTRIEPNTTSSTIQQQQQQAVEDDTPPPTTSRILQATTRDIWTRPITTVFDIYKDVIPLQQSSNTNPTNNKNHNPTVTFRPFCNVIIKGIPMYIHPELIHEPNLRKAFFF